MVDVISSETFGIFILGLCHTSTQFLLSHSAKDLERCPNAAAHGKYMYSFQGKCYEFVLYNEKYWTDARRDCQSKGGDLVIVDNATIQEFIVATLITLGNIKTGLWLGLTDSRHELHWEWVNGEPLQGYNNWAHLQGGANALHFTQDCAQIRMNDNGRWHDKECHLWPQRFSYICQYDMFSTLPTLSSTSTLASTASPSSSVTTTDGKTSSRLTSFSDFYVANHTVTAPTSSLPWKPPAVSRLLTALTTKSSDTDNSLRTITVRKQGLTFTESMLINITSAFSTTENFTRHHTTGQLPTMGDADIRWDNSSMKANAPSLPSIKEVMASAVATERPVVCYELNCAKSCPGGYSGVYVDLNGCINCRCN